MGDIDFTQEIASHVIWNVRLQCFLDGGECITKEQAISHKQCCLGKWLYSKGMVKYGVIPEMQEFEKIHKKAHKAVSRIIQMKNKGDVYSAETELAKLKLINERIIFLLNIIEGEVKEQGVIQ
ncbi:MAG: hypothetical protein GY853_14765 [PVC group bacterium]|nr:hypothetical protein [PVC group bacterium]